MAVEAGADALGFILIPSARRYVGADVTWLSDLPPFVSKVAVVADLADLDPHLALYFDSVQYYADTAATAGQTTPLHLRRMPVVRLQGEESLELLSPDSVVPSAMVLDAYHPKALGGTGVQCDWDLAARAIDISTRPVILAGGLTPENVKEAIAQVKPYGVDVSSGVEAEIRRKDPAKVRAFIAAARAATSY